MFFGTLGF